VASGGALTERLQHHAAAPSTVPSSSQRPSALTSTPGGAAAPLDLGRSPSRGAVGASDPAVTDPALSGSSAAPGTGISGLAGAGAPPAHAHDDGGAPRTIRVPSHPHPAHPAHPAHPNPPEGGGGTTPQRPAPTPAPPAQGNAPDSPPPPPPAHGRAPSAPRGPPDSLPAAPPSGDTPADPGAASGRGSPAAAAGASHSRGH